VAGVPGDRANAFFAVISSHHVDGSYGVKHVIGVQKERGVPAFAVHKHTSWLSLGAQRATNQLTSQQQKEKVQLEKQLAKTKNENEALLRTCNLATKERKTMEAERAAILRGAAFSRDGKTGVSRQVQPLVDSIIAVVRERVATETVALEKEAVRLERRVANREKTIEELEHRLELKLKNEEKRSKRKDLALRQARSSKAATAAVQGELDEAEEEMGRMKRELEKAKEELLFEAPLSTVLSTRTKKKGRPYSDKFEAFAVRSLAGGISAPQLRNQMLEDKDFFLEHLSQEERDEFVVPEIDWFIKLRERVGTEALLHAFVKIAGAKEVQEFGFDEAEINGQSTLNQWCKILLADGGTEIVTIGVGGILVGGKAAEVTAQIEKSWDQGQAAFLALRTKLGVVDADQLAPMVNGGVNLLKLRSLMHDTVS
jgi:hypothetical protein